MKRVILLGTLYLRIFFVFFFFAAFSVRPSFAVTTSLSNVPSTIGSDPFTINVSVSGAGNGKNYLRIDLYKDGSSNYFGETYNGSNWYNGSDGLQYAPITIASSSGSASLQGRFGNPTTTEYDGTGTYKLRVRRYTSGSNYGSEANDSSVVVAISIPTATPTASPSATPANTPTPTKTPTLAPTSSSPSSTPTKIPTLTVTPIVSPTTKISPTPTKTKEVLGQKIEAPTPTIAELEMAPQESDNSDNVIPALFISIGGVILILCGILAFKPGMMNDLLAKLPWKR